MKTFEELKRIYDLHELYQKHDENNLFCHCGKDRGALSIYLYIKFLEDMTVEDSRKLVKYFGEKESEKYVKRLWSASLYLKTNDPEDLTIINDESVTRQAIHDTLTTDPTKVNVLYKKYPKLISKTDIFDCWEHFEDKVKFSKKYHFGGDLENLVRTDLKTIDSIEINKTRLLHLSLSKELLNKYIVNIYKVVSKSRNIYLSLSDKSLIENLVKDKRLYLLYLLLNESAVNLFVEYHQKLPIEMLDQLEFELDKKLARIIQLEKVNYHNNLLLAYNKKIYNLKIDKEDLWRK